MFEMGYVGAWVGATLKANATLLQAPPTGVSGRVYEGLPPQGAVRPLIRFHEQAGTVQNCLDQERSHVVGLFTVAAVVDGSDYGQAVTLMDAVDAALHGGGLITSSGLRLSCEAIEQRLLPPDIEVGGAETREALAVFEVLAEAA